MTLDVNEPIDVSAIFRSGQLRPLSFVWKKRLYKTHRITGRYKDFRGKWQRHHYAVQAKTGDIYEIYLDTEHMDWYLTKIHCLD